MSGPFARCSAPHKPLARASISGTRGLYLSAVCHYGCPHFIYNNWLETVTRLCQRGFGEFMKSALLRPSLGFSGVLVFWRRSRCGRSQFHSLWFLAMLANKGWASYHQETDSTAVTGRSRNDKRAQCCCIIIIPIFPPRRYLSAFSAIAL